jgi:hypothetical protein
MAFRTFPGRKTAPEFKKVRTSKKFSKSKPACEDAKIAVEIDLLKRVESWGSIVFKKNNPSWEWKGCLFD